jgi:glutamate racemase
MKPLTATQPTARVLVFDSGVGGLSIAEPIMRQFPSVQIIYCADNRYFPYGTKSEDVVRARVCEVIKTLTDRYLPQLVVIACNTASMIALEAVRFQSKTPIVGVVPAIKPAAEGSQSKAIGILATPAAVQSAYIQRLVDDFAKGCRVVLHGSSVLVELAEQKLRGFSVDLAAIHRELAPFQNQQANENPVDSIVLGCTHFPLLREEMQAVCDRAMQFIDSGNAIARRVGTVLADWLKEHSHEVSQHTAVFTESTAAVSPLEPTLLSRGFNRIEILGV